MNNLCKRFWFSFNSFASYTALLALFQFTSSAQTLHFEAFHNDRKIGTMKVIREVSDERTKIWVTSKVRIKLPYRGSLQYETLSTYMDGKLLEAEGILHRDSKMKSLVSIYLNSDGYQMEKGDLIIGLKPEAILGTDLFYFEEPTRIKEACLISSGDLLSIEKLDGEEGTYRFSGPAIQMYYSYQNGELAHIKLQSDAVTVLLRVKKST